MSPKPVSHHLRYAATVGVFDGVHRGHQWLLSQLCAVARRRGLGAMAITLTPNPATVLSPGAAVEEITPLAQRLLLLKAAGADEVETLHFTPALAALTARRFAQMLHDEHAVDVLLMGFNNRIGCDRCSARDFAAAAEAGVEVIETSEYVGDASPVSSSIVRRLLADGLVSYAARKMGRCLARRGVVVHGEHIGTTLGFPTANVSSDGGMLPRAGVYAVRVLLGDRWHDGMANLGVRPTMGDNNPKTLEVHIFDFDSDIYGESITVEFVERLRDEQKMRDGQQLAQQLENDRKNALAALQTFRK